MYNGLDLICRFLLSLPPSHLAPNKLLYLNRFKGLLNLLKLIKDPLLNKTLQLGEFPP